MRDSKKRNLNKQTSHCSAISNDAKEISKLAGQHTANPNGFISSLETFFRDMSIEMANRKGGIS